MLSSREINPLDSPLYALPMVTMDFYFKPHGHGGFLEHRSQTLVFGFRVVDITALTN